MLKLLVFEDKNSMLKVKVNNDFGEITLEIKISTEYYIYIKETNTDNKIVELSQYNVLWSSNEFSFSSSEDIMSVINEAFNKSHSHINSKDGEEWKLNRMKSQLKRAKNEVNNYLKDDHYDGKWQPSD
jgi:hypothetical protein